MKTGLILILFNFLPSYIGKRTNNEYILPPLSLDELSVAVVVVSTGVLVAVVTVVVIGGPTVVEPAYYIIGKMSIKTFL